MRNKVRKAVRMSGILHDFLKLKNRIYVLKKYKIYLEYYWTCKYFYINKMIINQFQ